MRSLPARVLVMLAVSVMAPAVLAQSSSAASSAPSTADLPGVTVTAPYTRNYGGYVISGDFKVDPRMPTVVFPAKALVKDDILSVRPVHLNDDEYLVLQECAVADCRMAHVVRVWNAGGGLGAIQNSEMRIWIKHENKYFIWMQRLPEIPIADCVGCNTRFTRFQPFSPPMTLEPIGDLAAHHQTELDASANGPVPVATEKHEGSTYVVTYKGGATVRIQRMHAAR